MKKQLDENLVKDFPKLFADRNASPTESCMSFGFECGDGWEPIIRKCAEVIESINNKIDNPDDWIVATQIKEKYGCYDDKTEVLTENGWKLFKDVNIKEEKIAILDDKDKLKYAHATAYHEYDYVGNLYRIESRGVSLAVTLNHQLWVAKAPTNGGENNCGRKEFPFQFQTYENLYRQSKIFKKSAFWKGKKKKHFILPAYFSSWKNTKVSTRSHYLPPLQLDMKPWLQFLGWYVAEGSCSGSEAILSLNGTDGGKEVEKVIKILDQLPFKYSIRDYKKPSVWIKIGTKQLTTWLEENCGKGAYNKKTPEFIKVLSPDLIYEYLDSLYMGDGYQSSTARTLTTISTQLEKDVSELLLKINACSRTHLRNIRTPSKLVNGKEIINKYPAYEINWLKHSNIHQHLNSHDTKQQIEKKEFFEKYKGKVYCLTVPFHRLYVRRNFKPVWCGNSLRFYISGAPEEYSEQVYNAIDTAELDSEITCETCGQPGELRGTSWLYTACDSCHKERV